ncbi:MAG: hypothetical protein Q9218_004966 [Villophora microphyllina]
MDARDILHATQIPEAGLSKRSHNWNIMYHTPIGDGWVASQTLLDLVFPFSPIAQHQMELFFTQVLSLSGDTWLNEPWRTEQTATWGDIMLKFISSSPLPQGWIHDYLIWSHLAYGSSSNWFFQAVHSLVELQQEQPNKVRCLGLSAPFFSRDPE